MASRFGSCNAQNKNWQIQKEMQIQMKTQIKVYGQVLLVRGIFRGCNALSPPSTETEICQLDKFANVFPQVLILTCCSLEDLTFCIWSHLLCCNLINKSLLL